MSFMSLDGYCVSRIFVRFFFLCHTCLLVSILTGVKRVTFIKFSF